MRTAAATRDEPGDAATLGAALGGPERGRAGRGRGRGGARPARRPRLQTAARRGSGTSATLALTARTGGHRQPSTLGGRDDREDRGERGSRPGSARGRRAATAGAREEAHPR